MQKVQQVEFRQVKRISKGGQLEFISQAIKQTKLVRVTFKTLSIIFGLLALSPIVVGSLMPQELVSSSNAYLLNMSQLLTQVFATAFTFVALDYLLKPRVTDLKEMLGFEQNREVVSALIGSYTRNLRNSSIFLLVASAGFVFSSLSQLGLAIQYTSLGLTENGGPAAEIYFLKAFQPLLTALVLCILAIFLLRQANRLRSGLDKLQTTNIDLN
jgi:hypothetical protein